MYKAAEVRDEKSQCSRFHKHITSLVILLSTLCEKIPFAALLRAR